MFRFASSPDVGTRITPGDTQFNRMPCGARSTASDALMWITRRRGNARPAEPGLPMPEGNVPRLHTSK